MTESRDYLGKMSDSKRTTSNPSRAKTHAAKEPAGPPPTTRTVHFVGMSITGAGIVGV